MNNSSIFKPVICAVGFSRVHALSRLLRSINSAHYPFPVKLVISLDGGALEKVVRLAKEFDFQHGDVEVVTRDENLGLREHILWCGDLSQEYGAVIILEDDLMVDPYYYNYACNALQYYKNEPRVSGVALYSPHYNEGAALPFLPMHSNLSVYAMAVACSWGQAWTASQWRGFKQWYGNGEISKVDKCDGLPEHIKAWPESSWKKYFSAYVVEHDLYFVYPYRSYTTNCSDAGGTHMPTGTNLHQVPLADPARSEDQFCFSLINDRSMIRYDPYMESDPLELESMLGLPTGSLAVDLYGTKSLSEIIKKDYCVTTKPAKMPINRFSMSFRPVEKNLFSPDEIGPISLVKSEDVLPDKVCKSAEILDYWSGIPLWTRLMLETQLKVWPRKIISKLTGRSNAGL